MTSRDDLLKVEEEASDTSIQDLVESDTDNPNETKVRSRETPAAGSNLLLRTPSGFEVYIPARYITARMSNSALLLELPSATAQRIILDLATSTLKSLK